MPLPGRGVGAHRQAPSAAAAGDRAVESAAVLGRRVLLCKLGDYGAGGEIPAGCSVLDKAGALGIKGAIEMSTVRDTMLLSTL